MGKKSKSKEKSKATRGGLAQDHINKHDDLDAQCKKRVAELVAGAVKNRNKTLRFDVGTRVKCGMHKQSDDDIDRIDFDSLSIADLLGQAMRGEGAFEMSWFHGTVVQLWYCEAGRSQYHPYQVRLDDGRLIYASRDSDDCIQKSNLPLPAIDSYEETLFKQPPQREDCPICFVPLPLHMTRQTTYYSCCGKVICLGCIVSAEDAGLDRVCPFCRAPDCGGNDERIIRLQKRVEANDPEAMLELGVCYCPKDKKKAFEMMMRAADLDLCTAHYNVAVAYRDGEGVQRNLQKAKFHNEVAAVAGHGGARYNLATLEMKLEGNQSRALRHLMVAASQGYAEPLEDIKEYFLNGGITKDDLLRTLRSSKESLGEIKSEARDKAAAKYPYKIQVRVPDLSA